MFVTSRDEAVRVAAYRVIVAAGIAASLARPALAQQGWTDVVHAVSAHGTPTGEVRLVTDASGDSTAIWTQATPPSGLVVMASRGSPASGVWQPPVPVSPPGVPHAELALAADAAGGAMAAWATDDGIYAARRDSGGAWSAATPVATRTNALQPRIAVDAAGNAVLAWYLDAVYTVEAVRFDATSGTWGVVTALPGAGHHPDVAVDALGNAMVVWPALGGQDPLLTARYAAATATWGAPQPIAGSGGSADLARVVVDADGDVTAAWRARAANGFIVVQWAQYGAFTGAWSPAATLTYVNPLSAVDSVALATQADGALALLWSEPLRVILLRRSPSAAGWAAPTVIGLPPVCAPGSTTPRCHTWQRAYDLQTAIDANGQTFFAWHLLDGRLQAGRLGGADATAVPSFLTTPTGFALSPQVVVDASGTGTVSWSAPTGVQSSRWIAAPAAPLITGITAAPAALSIAFQAPPTSEIAFAPVTYEYSLDDGASWAPRVPAGITSPLDLAGLTSGAPLAVRLRAVNGAGRGLSSAMAVATPGPTPGPPIGLTVTAMSGNTLTLSWLAPANSTPATDYLLEGGVAPGQPLVAFAIGSAATTLTLTAPPGTFFVRMLAVAAGLVSVPSNEIQVFVRVPAPPSAPQHLLALVDGSDVALSWTNTFAGGVPESLWLVVSGGIDAVAPMAVVETLAFGGVPPGTYVVQVVAVNASGVSAPSNPVTLTVPGACSGVPGPPARVVATVAGSIVTVSWSPPDSGAAASAYDVSVTGSVQGSVSTTARTISGTVPAGRLTVTVAALNRCGAGAPAPAVDVTVP